MSSKKLFEVMAILKNNDFVSRYIEVRNRRNALAFAEEMVDDFDQAALFIVDLLATDWPLPESGQVFSSTVGFDEAVRKYKEENDKETLTRSDELRAFLEELLANVCRD